MKGFHFSKYTKRDDGKSDFEKLLDIFMQLLDYLLKTLSRKDISTIKMKKVK